MSYVSDIRRLVGSKPIVLVGATIIVLNDKGEILLNRRSDTGTWGIPGGSMELGEELEETAARELYEETGLRLKKARLVDVLSGEKCYFKYPNGDEAYCVICLYEAIKVEGQIWMNDDESTELGFFSFGKLPELESRAAYVIEQYLGME
jgi:8-oxo-dGTP pyrophosphatase MutT (NUDIX family)